MYKYILTFLICLPTILYSAPPEELGKVRWLRNLEQALQESKQSSKPILLLFQEVPGCLTCKRYGNIVLSHPLIVEVIEDNFVPLAIFNNKPGKDASVLRYYEEPSWNNPVVRMISSDKKDIQPRLNAKYQPSDLVQYIISGMKLLNKPIPSYLQLLFEELDAEENGVEKTTLSMYCFWTGEKELGKLNGVVKTEAGFMDNREVVNVYFDPSSISLEEIVKEGKKRKCADALYLDQQDSDNEIREILSKNQIRKSTNFRMDKEPKYYLAKTTFSKIPMTPMQAVKINAAIGLGQDPKSLLSPRQLKIFAHLEKVTNPTWASKPHDPDWQNKMFIAWDGLAI